MSVTSLDCVLGEVVIVSYEGDYQEETGTYEGPGFAKLDNECTYEGDFHNGLFHGKGKFSWTNGVVYEGEFKFNKLTGNGSYSYPDGSVYKGQIFDGRRHGKGKLTNSLGQIYDGEWSKGLRHGKGTMYYNDDKSSYYTGEWVDNLREGLGVMIYPSGNSYDGHWYQDKKCGFGIMTWKDLDELYIGEWFDDKPHGYGEHLWGESTSKTIKIQNCNIYRGEFLAGKRTGKGSFFYMNGSQYSGFWKDDLKHGPGVFIHADGRIMAGEYDLNRLIIHANSPESKQRATEDVSTQYHLNIDDVYYTFPTSLTMSQYTKHIADVERLLLKYNSYIKALYKRYYDATNRMRQRGILHYPYEYYTNQSPDAKETAPDEALQLRAIETRNIQKRFLCITIKQLIQCFRELEIIGFYLNAYDVTHILQDMREQHYTTAIDKYLEFMQSSTPPGPSSSSLSAFSSRPITTENSNEINPTGEVPTNSLGESTLPTEPISPSYSVKDVLSLTELSIGRLLDSYQQPLANQYPDEFYALADQPILEHEFVELFVRAIAQSFGCRGKMALGYPMEIYPIVEKILAKHVLPLLNDAERNTPDFYRCFYQQIIQDLLLQRTNSGRKSAIPGQHPTGGHHHHQTHHQTTQNQSQTSSPITSVIESTKLEKIWLSLRAQENPNLDISNIHSLIVNGGYITLKTFIQWIILTFKTNLPENADEKLIVELIFKPIDPSSSSAALNYNDYRSELVVANKINFEDYLEYLCRVLLHEQFRSAPSPDDPSVASEELKEGSGLVDEFGVTIEPKPETIEPRVITPSRRTSMNKEIQQESSLIENLDVFTRILYDRLKFFLDSLDQPPQQPSQPQEIPVNETAA